MSENNLVIGEDAYYVQIKRYFEPVQSLALKAFGRAALIASDEFPIVSVSEYEIVLKSPYDDEFPLTRLRRVRSDQQ